MNKGPSFFRQTKANRELNNNLFLLTIMQTLPIPQKQIYKCQQQNKNYFVVRNAGCPQFRFTFTL